MQCTNQSMWKNNYNLYISNYYKIDLSDLADYATEAFARYAAIHFHY